LQLCNSSPYSQKPICLRLIQYSLLTIRVIKKTLNEPTSKLTIEDITIESTKVILKSNES
jgi:hypothetical protein